MPLSLARIDIQRSYMGCGGRACDRQAWAVAGDIDGGLRASADAGVVGAAHAGWKGAIGGVTDRTVAAMEALGASRSAIVAAIGPCIGRASYEVTDAFALRFEAEDGANERFFSEGRAGHRQFDIAAYVAARVAGAGVGRVELLDEDTYSQADRFFSYRRSCHLGEADYGRQLSVIGLGL